MGTFRRCETFEIVWAGRSSSRARRDKPPGCQPDYIYSSWSLWGVSGTHSVSDPAAGVVEKQGRANGFQGPDASAGLLACLAPFAF